MIITAKCDFKLEAAQLFVCIGENRHWMRVVAPYLTLMAESRILVRGSYYKLPAKVYEVAALINLSKQITVIPYEQDGSY